MSRKNRNKKANAAYYDDNWKEGDEPITLGDLPEYEKIKGSHDKFRSILNRAKSLNKESTEALDDKYLEETVKKVVSKVLNEIGNTDQGLGAVAQNVDRRTTQMGTVYKNANSTVPQKMNAMGKAMNAQGYLAQAIRNAIANGMSEQQIEAVLKQNMSRNYNPTYGNGVLTWNRR